MKLIEFSKKKITFFIFNVAEDAMIKHMMQLNCFIRWIDQARKDCKIPAHMVPKCLVCGGPMDMNLRKDHCFVQDEDWNFFLLTKYSGRPQSFGNTR